MYMYILMTAYVCTHLHTLSSVEMHNSLFGTGSKENRRIPLIYLRIMSLENKCQLKERELSLIAKKMTQSWLPAFWQKKSKIHKRLKERFLIGRNRTKRAYFRESLLYQVTYNLKTEKQTIHSACVRCGRLAEGKGSFSFHQPPASKWPTHLLEIVVSNAI